MKTFKKSIIYVIVVAIATAGLTSCSDFLKEYSQDLAKVNGWQDLDEVLLGDAYMHSARAYDPGNYNSPTTDGDADGLNILHYMTDEITLNPNKSCDYMSVLTSMFPFYTWQQDTGTNSEFKYAGGDAKYWNNLYQYINVCNMVIALIDEQPETSVDDAVQKERVKGEAYFLRGMYYFFLANMYAQPYVPSTASSLPGVPVKTTEYIEDIEFDRGTLEETYSQIVNDLENAAEFLDGKSVKSKYHGDKAAALLMLSRVNLYMQNWDKAIAYAYQVLSINNRLLDLHSVMPGANSISLTSPETIFTMGQSIISFNFTSNSTGRYMPAFRVSDEILSLYDNNDLRQSLYVGNTSTGNYQGAYLKFNLQYGKWGGMNDVSSYCLLRTPEAYLIKAEALAYKGDNTSSCKVLNQFLKTRMKDTFEVNLTGNSLIDFIREERAREFLLEGHRWFDLRRYTVCEPYPWSKTIEHTYNYYEGYYYSASYADVYRLEEFDLAYTLPIPREIREFQTSIGDNYRPVRSSNRINY